ncbi:MAG: prolipoprotein diacylglyceryl transferase family protein [Actinomycetota bacterium]
MDHPFLAAVGWPVVDRVVGLSPHGLFIAIGFMVGSVPFGRLARRRGISIDAVNSVVFWSLIAAIVGARVGYVIGHVSEFSGPLEWFEIWNGGISLLGGIAGATIANAVNIRRFGLRFFQVADAIAPALAMGIGIGRIGDLIIGDHLGKPTSWLLAWRYGGGTLAPPFRCLDELCSATLVDGSRQVIGRGGAFLQDVTGTTIAEGIGVHQTALYDMVLGWVLFGVLWWFIRSDRREGMATLLFGVWYGGARLLEDSLRIDKRFGPLTGSQWTALTVVTVCVAVFVFLAVTKREGATSVARTAPDPAPEPEEAPADP